MARPQINLDAFDAADDDDLGAIVPRREKAPAKKAAPRKRTAKKAAPRTSSTDEVDSEPTADATHLDEPTDGSTTDQVEATPVTKAKRGPGRPKLYETPNAPSNCYVPVEIRTLAEEKTRTDRISNGELIIKAIESTYQDGTLQKAINPPQETGGGLFAPRKTRAIRPADVDLTTLNFRMQPADFGVLDGVVDEVGASSRSHLITEALALYLKST